MGKRTKSRTKLPVVDDADVQQVADLFLTGAESVVSDERLTELAEQAAEVVAYRFGNTKTWRSEFIRNVKRRVQFGLMAKRGAKTPK